MNQYAEITPQQAWQMMQEKNATLVDVRNELHFAQQHPKQAFHLTNQSYGEFEIQQEDDQAVIVICYHGVSSRNVAMYLIEQGYSEVYSVIGGFENWQRAGLPVESAV